MSVRRSFACAVAAFVAFSSPAHSQAVPADAAGSRDHALVKRYENSWILGYELKQFTDYTLALGPLRQEAAGGGNVRYEVERKQTIEGRHTRLLYVVPVTRSTLEVQRNYLEVLEAAGFKGLFSCARAECGFQEGVGLFRWFLYPESAKLKNKGQMTQFALSFPDEARYAAMWRDGEAPVYVSLYVAKETSGNFPETKDKVVVLLDVVETKPMDRRMTDPKSNEMKSSLDKDGKVALYGILFDFNKTEIKPESTATLNEVAKLLKDNPAIKLYVVGHTDAVGAMQYNKTLSEKRAEAVVAWLARHHGIAGDRLVPAGVGPLAPVATNATEEGRAKNRRVELVLRP